MLADAVNAGLVSAVELVERRRSWVLHVLLAFKELDLACRIVNLLNANDYNRVPMIWLLILMDYPARLHIGWVP